MSKFTDTRDAVEKWFTTGLHSLWTALAPGLEKGGEAIATNVVTAVSEAHQNGVGGKDLLNTGIEAAKTSALSIGVNIGLEEAAALVGMATGHVATGEQTAPPPPAP